MKVDNLNIYEQIGNLFYSIASEQHVKPLEVGELKSLISRDWPSPKLNEYFVSDETHCIVMTMDSLEGNQVSAKEAFEEFSRFYTSDPEVFSDEVRQRMLDTAVNITKIFKADNPLDNPQLAALKDLLKLEMVKT